MPEEKSVERYVVGPDLEHPGFCQMHPAESGGWVPWDDYARLQARLGEVEGHRTACEVVLEEAIAEFESHAISELPHIAYGYGKARDWLRRRLLRVHRERRGSWIHPEPHLRPFREADQPSGKRTP